MNATFRLIFNIEMVYHVTPVLQAPKCISFKLASPIYMCLNVTTPNHLSLTLRRKVDIPGISCLRCDLALTSTLTVPRTPLPTIDDRDFSVAAARILKFTFRCLFCRFPILFLLGSDLYSCSLQMYACMYIGALLRSDFRHQD
jgi:hypothetical protein